MVKVTSAAKSCPTNANGWCYCLAPCAIMRKRYAIRVTPLIMYKPTPFQLVGKQHMRQHKPSHLTMMAASSYDGRQFQHKLQQNLSIPVNILPNTQFLIGRYNPIPHPQPDKRYVMETFYRHMRRHFNLLMDGDEPVGGQWNFDKANRKRLPKDDQPKQPITLPSQTPSPNKLWPKWPPCQMGLALWMGLIMLSPRHRQKERGTIF